MADNGVRMGSIGEDAWQSAERQARELTPADRDALRKAAEAMGRDDWNTVTDSLRTMDGKKAAKLVLSITNADRGEAEQSQTPAMLTDRLKGMNTNEKKRVLDLVGPDKR
jgi:hypothetical protein